jgi:hypothetical protein
MARKLCVCVFNFWLGTCMFLFTTNVYRSAPGLAQPPIKWILWTIILKLRWPERVADHSALSSAQVTYIHSIALDRALASLSGFMIVWYVQCGVISPTINLVLAT